MTQEMVDTIGTAVMLALMLAAASGIARWWHKLQARRAERRSIRRMTRAEMTEGLERIIASDDASPETKARAKAQLEALRGSE